MTDKPPNSLSVKWRGVELVAVGTLAMVFGFVLIVLFVGLSALPLLRLFL